MMTLPVICTSNGKRDTTKLSKLVSNAVECNFREVGQEICDEGGSNEGFLITTLATVENK